MIKISLQILILSLFSFPVLGMDLKSCPTSPADWIQQRERLKLSSNIAEFAELGLKFKICSEKAPQKFKNLKSCFEPLVKLAGLIETPVNDEWISLEGQNRLRDSDLLKLPPEFSDPSFLATIASGQEAKIRKSLKKIQSIYPSVVTFRYLSHLEPEVYIYISVLDLKDRLLIIDYDAQLNINVYTETKTSPVKRALTGISREDLTLKPPEFKLSANDLDQSVLKARLSEQGGRCYQCHQAPILPIVPLKSVKSFSQTMESGKIISWFNTKYAQRTDPFPTNKLSFLPEFGRLTSAEAATLQKSCLPNTKSLQAIRAQEAMQCSHCHGDGQVMPALRLPFGPFGEVSAEGDRVEWDLRVHQDLNVSPHLNALVLIPQLFIENGHMPPDFGDALSSKERKEIVQCLTNYYFKSQGKNSGFSRALLKESCE